MSTGIEIKNRTQEERLTLLGDLWDSFSAEQVPFSEAQRSELNRRLDEFEQDQDPGIPWDEVLRRILGETPRQACGCRRPR